MIDQVNEPDFFERFQHRICDRLLVRAIEEGSKVDDGDFGVVGLCHGEVNLREYLFELPAEYSGSRSLTRVGLTNGDDVHSEWLTQSEIVALIRTTNLASRRVDQIPPSSPAGGL